MLRAIWLGLGIIFSTFFRIMLDIMLEYVDVSVILNVKNEVVTEATKQQECTD